MSDMYNVAPAKPDDKLGPHTKQALREARWFVRWAVWVAVKIGLRRAGL